MGFGGYTCEAQILRLRTDRRRTGFGEKPGQKTKTTTEKFRFKIQRYERCRFNISGGGGAAAAFGAFYRTREVNLQFSTL